MKKTKAVVKVQPDRLASALAKVEGKSPRTTEAYGRAVQDFVAYCAAKKKPVAVDSVAGFLKSLKGKSASFQNVRLFALKKAFKQAAERLQLGAGRAAVVAHALNGHHSVKVAEPDVEVLTTAELEILWLGLPLRVRLMGEFMYQTGCRVSELCQVRQDQVKVNGRVEVLLHGKGNRQRVRKITLELFNRIKKTFGEGEYLFTTKAGQPFSRTYISREISRASWRLFKKPFGSHVLRHSRATHLYQKTGRLKAVSNFLGHSSVDVTAKYYVQDRLKDEDLFTEKDLQPE